MMQIQEPLAGLYNHGWKSNFEILKLRFNCLAGTSCQSLS